MRRMIRMVQIRAEILSFPNSPAHSVRDEVLPELGGYIQRQPIQPRARGVKIYRSIMIEVLGQPEMKRGRLAPQPPKANPRRRLQIHPVGRLVPVSNSSMLPETVDPRTLQPVPSGQAYVITSPPTRGLVTPALCEALKTVFEQFAVAQGFTSEKPLEISLSRGYMGNSHGHKEGRAADIAVVGGKTLLQWKQDWDAALNSARKLADPQQRSEVMAVEQQRNLGHALYRALQAYGGWRVNPKGWRVYQNVMQLFGPWTATEGPWKAMRIESPTPEERQRLADQQWVFQAHQDHIHVAR